jgi:hypothetical protein
MDMMEQIKYKAYVTKYSMKYAVAREGIVERELEGIKDKYDMSSEDYARMLIGIEILTIKRMKGMSKGSIKATECSEETTKEVV